MTARVPIFNLQSCVSNAQSLNLKAWELYEKCYIQSRRVIHVRTFQEQKCHIRSQLAPLWITLNPNSAQRQGVPMEKNLLQDPRPLFAPKLIHLKAPQVIIHSCPPSLTHTRQFGEYKTQNFRNDTSVIQNVLVMIARCFIQCIFLLKRNLTGKFCFQITSIYKIS